MSLVLAAWPFEEVQTRYQTYEHFVSREKTRLSKGSIPISKIFSLLQSERHHWKSILELDPFMPRALWPSGYKGERIFKMRDEFLREITHYIQAI